MSDQQLRRMNRMLGESHYLLSVALQRSNVVSEAADVEDEQQRAQMTTKLRFDVSGSTGNVYGVALSRHHNCVSTHCSCPDFENFAARFAVACKHCCFILCRVLRLDLLQQRSLRSLPLRHWSRMVRRASRLDRRPLEESSLTNRAFLKRYRRAQKRKTASHASDNEGQQQSGFTEEQRAAFGICSVRDWQTTAKRRGATATSQTSSAALNEAQTANNVIKGDGQDHVHDQAGTAYTTEDNDVDESGKADDAETEDCAICFEALADRCDGDLICCGQCGNCAHRACIDEWITIGKHEDCVYCRAFLPYAALVTASDRALSAKRRRRVVDLVSDSDNEEDDGDDNNTAPDGTVYLNVAQNAGAQ